MPRRRKKSISSDIITNVITAERLTATTILAFSRELYMAYDKIKKDVPISYYFRYLRMLFPNRDGNFIQHLYFVYRKFVVEAGFTLNELIDMDVNAVKMAVLPRFSNAMDKFAIREVAAIAMDESLTYKEKRSYIWKLQVKRVYLQRMYRLKWREYDAEFVEKLYQAKKVLSLESGQNVEKK